jgi:mono/diheme cytochrome c family protein
MKKALLLMGLSFLSVASKAQRKAVLDSNMLMGQKIYLQRCITCHQVDGGGAQNMIPPLIKTDYVLGDKTRIIKILLNGMKGEIMVNGDMYSNEMPSQGFLTDKEIAAVLTYVRNSFGNKASMVTTGEVKKIRANPKY